MPAQDHPQRHRVNTTYTVRAAQDAYFFVSQTQGSKATLAGSHTDAEILAGIPTNAP